MTDNSSALPGIDNIRTLSYFLGMVIDNKLANMRRETPYAQVRPSDIRVFVTAARSPKSISAIARELHISRQAAQSSVQRLQDLGVVEAETSIDNRRDRVVVITPRGRMAGATAASQITQVEQEFAAVIGPEAWAEFRQNFKKLVQAFAVDLAKAE